MAQCDAGAPVMRVAASVVDGRPAQMLWPAQTSRSDRPIGILSGRPIARQAVRHKRYGPPTRLAQSLWSGRPSGTNVIARQAARHKRYGPPTRLAQSLWSGRPPGTNVMVRQAAGHECYGPAGRPAQMLWPGRPPGTHVAVRQASLCCRSQGTFSPATGWSARDGVQPVAGTRRLIGSGAAASIPDRAAAANARQGARRFPNLEETGPVAPVIAQVVPFAGPWIV